MLATPERRSKLNTQLIVVIEKKLRELGLSARSVSIDVVGHDGLIRDIKKGNVPTADRLDALFSKLGVFFSLGETDVVEESISDRQGSTTEIQNYSGEELQSIASDVQQIKALLLSDSTRPKINNGSKAVIPVDVKRLEKAIQLTDNALSNSSKTLSLDNKARAYSLVYDMLNDDQMPTTDNIINLFQRAS